MTEVKGGKSVYKVKKNGLFFLLAISAVLLYPFFALADSGVNIFKSALVWRADAQGDYVVDEFSSPGTYAISPAYAAEGIVETITVNYKFKGEVSLEVSADNGRHYVPVVNGVPLRPVHSGKEIKWRVALGEDSELTEVRIVYTDASGVITTFGQPQLSGFKFRKRIAIARSNPSPSSSLRGEAEAIPEDLFNYQIPILVSRSADTSAPGGGVNCEGNVKADFSDVRFTCADGETILPHYLESIMGESPDKIAAFWVKIPQIPSAGLPIYMYYGNPQAQSKSSGKDVFDFFDDFTQDELDPEIWEVHPELGGSYELSDSRLKLDGVGITSRTYQFKDGIIEYRAKTEALLDSEYLTEQANFESRLIIRDSEEGLEQVAYSSAYEGAEHCLAIGDIVKNNQPKPILAGAAYIFKVKAQGNNLTFKRYSTIEGHSILNTRYSIPEVEISYTDEGGLKQGYIGLETGEGGTTCYDWLRVRKLAKQEPKIDTSRLALQEEVNSPLFTNITIAKDGSLVLADKYTEGTYISQEFLSPFSTRIIVPAWTVANSELLVPDRVSTIDYELPTTNYELSIDISANGGVSYKTNCKTGTRYYASKRDFAPGANLRYRLKLAKSGDSGAAENNIQSVAIDYHSGNIVLVSPNGGEDWEAGKRQKILWFASGHESAYPMRIEYSINDGKSYHPVIKQRKNIGVYFWNIPRRLSGKKLKIKVSDALDRNIYDVSNGPVVIQ